MTAHRVCPQSACAELNAPDAIYCHACQSLLIVEAPSARCYYCGAKVTRAAKACRAHMHLLRLDPHTTA